MANPFFLGINQGPSGLGPMPPPPPPQGPLPPHSQMPPHGPGPVLQHGPGPVLQHGPGGPPVNAPGHLSMMDPASNNAPLQFNPNKGKPPMAIPGKVVGPDSGTDEDHMKLQGEADGNSQSSSPPVGQEMSMTGIMNPNMMMNPGFGPMANPNMMMMPMPQFGQFGYMGPMGPGMGTEMTPPKEIINLKSCVLYPPPPNAPPPSTRERPPGCRTIFVGGLPENMTEEILREIYESCGPITSIRLSKKNFAHVRFESEESIDRALYISGYRIKIGNKDDKPNTGRIHVDYAQARDDLYEWECKQRALAREHRHRQRLEEERLRPPSPPPIIHYSDHEAGLLTDKLKGDETFMKATQVLVTWLERGDCSRRTSNMFYGMVQSVNSHVRRLMNEKAAHDLELEQMRLKFQQRLEGIIRQFEQIEKVFSSANKQKAWDHFSKAQRKNLDMWRKQAEEIRRMNQEEFLRDREEAEMEMSDSEDGEGTPVVKRPRRQEDMTSLADQAMKWAALKSQTLTNEDAASLSALKEENDSLKCQLEAYKNEVDLVKQEHKNAMEDKDRQIKALQQAFQGMQQQLIASKQQIKRDGDEMNRMRVKAASQGKLGSAESSQKEDGIGADGEASIERQTSLSEDSTSSVVTILAGINEKDARLIGIVSTFLHVHPFGANTDYISSYLKRLDISIRASEIEDLLEKLPSIYRQDLFGVGASLEKRWKFIGFDQKKNGDL